MLILVGCEESQVVTKAFRENGHEAYSCDILPCSGGCPEWHLQMDVFEAIKLKNWDAAIFFPDCTYLTITANKWYKNQPERKSGTLVGAKRREARKKAVSFFMSLYNCEIPLIAVENPIGVMSSQFRKPDQIIQPWQFGHAETKSTCLWLKGFPKLVETKIVEPVYYMAAGKKYSPTHYSTTESLGIGKAVGPGKERSMIRSKTYSGIASAMAKQWGNICVSA